MKESPHLPTKEQMQRLKNQDKTVLNELITNLLPYARDVVKWFIRNNPHLTRFDDDLHSEAMLCVSVSINDLLGSNFTTPGLLNYLRKAINGHCIDWLTENSLDIKVPARTISRKGMQFEQQKLNEHQLYTSTDTVHRDVDFNDYVESTFNETEQAVITELMCGFSVKRISERCELSTYEVQAIIRKIRKELYVDENFNGDWQRSLGTS